MEEGRKKQIEELAEQIGEKFIFNYAVDPYSIAAENNIRVFYQDYGDAFEGLIWKWSRSFNMHINARRIESLFTPRGRSTSAHELGHYNIPEHLERLNNGNSISFLGYNSCDTVKDPFEQEAECFATNLLLPKTYFTSVSSSFPDGFEAI